MAKQKRVTAAELMAELEQDPVWVEQRRLREESRRLLQDEYTRAEAPLVQELRAAGARVSSAWELISNTAAPYPEVLPILLDHLQRPYPEAVRDGIARALGVPEARFAWSLLVKLYRQEPAGRVKDGLAVAISKAAGPEHIGELIELARDPQLGQSRLLLLSALEQSGDPRAHQALEELATDPDLKKEIKLIFRCRERQQRRQRAQKMTN
jgi:hypothetical protein